MKLESLANELLLDLFEYFDTINLFRIFFGLNLRFNNLLLSYFHRYYLDLRSISKHDFDIACQQYLPSIINQIISLHISDDELPDLSKIFLSHDFTLNRFNHLQSISFYHIYSSDTLRQLIRSCHYLPHLTQLNMIGCEFKQSEDEIFWINNIWSLSKLTYYHNDTPTRHLILSKVLTETSPSIKNLSLRMLACYFHDLTWLFKCTPHLQRLSAHILTNSDDEQFEMVVLSIRSLNIIFNGHHQSMINLFQKMPNLCHLTLETWNMFLNGHEWKTILIDYLPKIKIFGLKMHHVTTLNDWADKQVNELLDTFRTDFWINEHRWFVRCDTLTSKRHAHAIVYTLPYASNSLIYNVCWSKSTCFNGKDTDLYNRVNRFIYKERKNQNYLPNEQFFNIQHLEIVYPFNDNFWLVVPTLKQLITLVIELDNASNILQLQVLLDQASRLSSLSFTNLKNFKKTLFLLKSISIRRLNFLKNSDTNIHYFDSKGCIKLAKSPLGQQCEVLLIGVKKRENILDLLNQMPKLRSLIICSRDNKQNSQELIQWLYNRLPSKFSIVKDKNQSNKIQLWVNC